MRIRSAAYAYLPSHRRPQPVERLQSQWVSTVYTARQALRRTGATDSAPAPRPACLQSPLPADVLRVLALNVFQCQHLDTPETDKSHRVRSEKLDHSRALARQQ